MASPKKFLAIHPTTIIVSIGGICTFFNIGSTYFPLGNLNPESEPTNSPPTAAAKITNISAPNF
jgi:hypothetical protein